MKRFGWTRLSAPGCKLTAHWLHTSGWEVRHCGHMTAIWPYYAIDPNERAPKVVALNGRGFRTLAVAFEAIEELVLGARVLWEGLPSKHGRTIRIVPRADLRELERVHGRPRRAWTWRRQ